MVRIEGEAGIGKSRLVAAFADRVKTDGFTIAAGAGSNVERNSAYLAARQMARWLLGLGPMEQAPPADQIAHVRTLLESMNPEWLLLLPLLGDLLDLPIADNETTAAFEPQLRRAALITLTIECIQAAARFTSLVLLVEDAQWLDEASLDILTALARVIDRTPILLLVVHRPGEPETAATVETLATLPNTAPLPVEGLDRAGTQALIESRLLGDVSPLALDLIDRQAQGNPFFCEELVDALRAAGDLQEVSGRDGKRWELAASVVESLQQARALVQVDDQWRIAEETALAGVAPGLPDSIHGAVLARYDRLDEGEKLTLKVASVIGRTAPTSLIESAFPTEISPPEIEQLLDRLARQNFLRQANRSTPETFEFAHNITQEIVYRLLLEEQRQDLHLRVGQALEQSTPNASDMLAHHFYNASLDDPEVRRRALEHLDKAAQRARRDYANEAALLHLGRALAMEPRWQRWAEQVEVLHTLGRRQEERAALEQLTAAPEAEPFRRALAWADLHESTSNYAEATRHLKTALAVARQSNDIAGEARCLARLGLIAWRQGDFTSAEADYQSALDRLRAVEQAKGEEADSRYGLGLVYRQQGRYDHAQVQFEGALATYRSLGNRQNEAKALIAIGHVEHYRHNLDEAVNSYRSALDLYRSTGDRAGVGTSLLSLAQGMSTQGGYSESWHLLHEALEIYQATSDLWSEILVWNELGIVAMMTGQLPEARHALERGLQLSNMIGDESGIAYTLCNLGQVSRDLGELDAASSLLNQGLDLTRKQGDSHLQAICLLDLALVSMAQGSYADAAAQATDSLNLFDDIDLRENNVTNLTTLAMAAQHLGDDVGARDLIDEALALLQTTGGAGTTFPQREYLICAAVYRQLGETELADGCMQNAHVLVQEQANRISDLTMRQSFMQQLPFNQEILSAAKR